MLQPPIQSVFKIQLKEKKKTKVKALIGFEHIPAI